MILLEQTILRKEQVKKTIFWLEFENNNKNKKYKIKVIYNSKVFIKELEKN